jgi:hypothetical protein
MNHKLFSLCGWLGKALLISTLVVAPVAAQGPAVRGVQPDSGRPGEEFDLTVRGDGFGGNDAWVAVDGLDVWDARIESDSVIRARVRIPEDAPPGPRDVEVGVSYGENEESSTVLAGGFSVLEGGGAPPEPGPQPPDEPGVGGGDDWEGLGWIVILGVGALAVAGVTLVVTVMLKIRKTALQKQWQTQAQEQDLPETCQSGTHYVKREKPEVKPGRWKVTGLKVTLYNASSRQRGVAREVSSELVERIDKAARNRLLWGDSGKLAEETAEIGRELAALVLAWQSLSEAGQDIYVEPRIEGGEASVKFILYRCTGQPGRWKKVMEWEAKVQAVDHFPEGFRGPTAAERPEPYPASLQDQLRGYIYNLVQEAGRLL